MELQNPQLLAPSTVAADDGQPRPEPDDAGGTSRWAGALGGMRRIVASAAAGSAGRAAQWVFPRVCLHCGRHVGTAGSLCPQCWLQVDWIEPPVCERLGTPFSHDPGAGTWSAAAIADPPPFERCRAAARHDGAARTLVHRFKFSDRMDLAGPLATWMLRAGRELIEAADVIVPVPLHPRRLWARRFNQAAVLADALGRMTDVAVHKTALRRVKATRHQVGLNARARRENVGGAFGVDPAARSELAGRRVLLVDDVITTGSTVRAASRALLKGGVAGVDVLAFAYAVGGEEQTAYIDLKKVPF